MKTFDDLEFKKHVIDNDGKHAIMKFDNKYGISVVRLKGSFGYPLLWEIAVLYEEDITYNTDITDDVIGHLTELEVTDVMRLIQNFN